MLDTGSAFSSELTIAGGFFLLAMVILVVRRQRKVLKAENSDPLKETVGFELDPHRGKESPNVCEPPSDVFSSVVDLETIAPGSLSSLIAKRNWARRRDGHGESSL